MLSGVVGSPCDDSSRWLLLFVMYSLVRKAEASPVGSCFFSLKCWIQKILSKKHYIARKFAVPQFLDAVFSSNIFKL